MNKLITIYLLFVSNIAFSGAGAPSGTPGPYVGDVSTFYKYYEIEMTKNEDGSCHTNRYTLNKPGGFYLKEYKRSSDPFFDESALNTINSEQCEQLNVGERSCFLHVEEWIFTFNDEEVLYDNHCFEIKNRGCFSYELSKYPGGTRLRNDDVCSIQ